MIAAMRSSNTATPRKTYKPPPPVPPRPSKVLVQEALAKTRQGHDGLNGSDQPAAIFNKAKSPIRQAPPPPPPLATRPQFSDLNKSSFSTRSGQPLNVVAPKKQAPQPVHSPPHPPVAPAYYERSISVDKVSSRPVVYQSDNCKRQLQVPPDVKRTESCKKTSADLKRTESIKKNYPVIKRQSLAEVKRSESIKKESLLELDKTESFKRAHKPAIAPKTNLRVNRRNSDEVENRSEVVVIDQTSDLVNKTEIILAERNIGIECKDEDVKSRSSTLESGISSKMSDSCGSSSSSKTNSLEKKWDKMLNDRNHVNTLIDEMFASVLEVSSGSSSNRSSTSEHIVRDSNDNKVIISNKIEDNVISSGDNLTVIVISDDSSISSIPDDTKSNTSTSERGEVKFNDRMNHEILINELQNMKNDQEKHLRRQRLPSKNLQDSASVISGDDRIHTNDWYGVNEGKEVKMSSCHITIEDANKEGERIGLDFERINKMSHLHGLPPLPKSLSGFNFMEPHPQSHQQRQTPPTPIRSSSIRSNQGPQLTPTHHGGYSAQARSDSMSVKKPSTLDTQLAILRREMYSLRQQDLSLLSQLWSLNESIQDFRQILQDQEDRMLSPPSPSPTPSSADEEEFYLSSTSIGYSRAPTSVVVGRKLSGSSAASGSVG